MRIELAALAPALSQRALLVCTPFDNDFIVLIVEFQFGGPEASRVTFGILTAARALGIWVINFTERTNQPFPNPTARANAGSISFTGGAVFHFSQSRRARPPQKSRFSLDRIRLTVIDYNLLRSPIWVTINVDLLKVDKPWPS